MKPIKIWNWVRKTLLNLISLSEKLSNLEKEMRRTTRAIEELKILVGSHSGDKSQLKRSLCELHEVEFKVFSQWGDDGIIQFLVSNLDIRVSTFVEFGVGDYQESNTRFLLLNNNWRGVVFDSSAAQVRNIEASSGFWKYDLVARELWVTVENINQNLREVGLEGEIGLLHIDIDGNDYWIWKAISVVQPVIVIVEYNSVLGGEKSLTVPYRQDFDRAKAHFSHLYFGASLPALIDLGREKGYTFVGSNSAGNNAYFIKDRAMNDTLAPFVATAKWVESRFRESRNEQGVLTYLGGLERGALINGLEVLNVKTGKLERLLTSPGGTLDGPESERVKRQS